MATGDIDDFFARLKARMPNGWFPLTSPILDAILRGIAAVYVPVYAAYVYALAQMRLQSSSDGWLDLAAVDYFGEGGLPRLPGERDPAYMQRIQINIVRERGTRYAVTKVLTDLTGRAPKIIEPSRPADTGAYGYAMGYGVAGAYGSILLAYQAFVTAYRPSGQGVPFVGGYGSSVGGYSTPSRASYVDISDASSGVADSQIYAAVASVIPAGTRVWVAISN